MWDKTTKALSAALGAAAGFFGGWNALLTVLCAVMALDYVTGLVCAWRGRSDKTASGGLSSRAGFDGLLKKAMIVFIILLSTLLDRALGNQNLMFQSAAACYYIANEGLSILENAALIGVPVPETIKKALDALKNKNKEE